MKTQDCRCPLPHGSGKFRLWTWEECGGHYTPGPDLEKAFLNARAHARSDGIAFGKIKKWWIQDMETGDIVFEHVGPLTLKEGRKAGLDV